MSSCTFNGQPVQCPAFVSSNFFFIFGLVWFAFCFIVGIITLVALWKMFKKAGKPGWACVIPIYNAIVILDMIKRPRWWFFLFLIPVVNIVFSIIMMLELAKAFGKDSAFGIGLFFLGPIFIMILGFGKAQYVYGSQTAGQTDGGQPDNGSNGGTGTVIPTLTISAPTFDGGADQMTTGEQAQFNQVAPNAQGSTQDQSNQPSQTS